MGRYEWSIFNFSTRGVGFSKRLCLFCANRRLLFKGAVIVQGGGYCLVFFSLRPKWRIRVDGTLVNFSTWQGAKYFFLDWTWLLWYTESIMMKGGELVVEVS